MITLYERIRENYQNIPMTIIVNGDYLAVFSRENSDKN